jgi:hypothetical protein
MPKVLANKVHLYLYVDEWDAWFRNANAWDWYLIRTRTAIIWIAHGY